MKFGNIIKRLRVDDPEKFRIADIDPGETYGLDLEKEEARDRLAQGVKRISELQELLFAQDRWAVLAIVQAMDTAGKGGAIEHVMSGVNPAGVQVSTFKVPSATELDHDFLWRTNLHLPERGRIGIFDRSYYEEVLVVRVRPEILARQKLPPQLITKNIWKERFKDIRAFERYMTRNGTLILKFHLRISKAEQKRRFLARLDEPAKQWKFAIGDVEDRKLWDKYMDAYEDMIRQTSTPEAPWYVIPADNKWFARLMVGAAMIDAMERLELHFPKLDAKALAELKLAREALLAERD